MSNQTSNLPVMSRLEQWFAIALVAVVFSFGWFVIASVAVSYGMPIVKWTATVVFLVAAYWVHRDQGRGYLTFVKVAFLVGITVLMYDPQGQFGISSLVNRLEVQFSNFSEDMLDRFIDPY